MKRLNYKIMTMISKNIVKSRTLYKLITLLVLFTSCEDVVKVDLETASPKLVIEASINWEKGTSGSNQKIKLTTTTDYYSNTVPFVAGATVFINNSTNAIFTFIEIPNTGEYVCANFVPVLNETYTLTVINKGQTYTATETFIAVPDINDEIQQNNVKGLDADEIEIKFFYQDNPLEENYYLASFNIPAIPFPQYDANSDELFQGNQMFASISTNKIHQNDIINMKLFGISRRYHNYVSKIIEAAGGGGPFPTTPATIRGNIVNQTNFENYALGYFSLSEVDTKTYTVQ